MLLENVGARPRSAKAVGLHALTVLREGLNFRQYPIGATMTPEITFVVTRAIAEKEPRSLNT